MLLVEGERGPEGTFWGAARGLGLDMRGGDMVYTYVKFHPSAPLRSVCDCMYVKSCLKFKGRNYSMIWGQAEGKASQNLEKVNKGTLLSQILLYLICLRDGIFHGSSGPEKMTPILESKCEGRGGGGPRPSSLI